jgi:hypothetical protein
MMCPNANVILHVRQEHVAQVPLAEHDDMIKAFPSDRAYQPFSMSILPRRFRRGWPVTNAYRTKTPGEYLAVDPVPMYFGAGSQPQASVSC